MERVRAGTNPRDFHYITQEEIHTTMGGLAVQVHALDQIMWREGGPRVEDQAQVVDILSRMRPLAVQLKRRRFSNHPRIQDYAPQLRRDIERALESARKEPPNYYYAGLVSGACNYCHAPPLGSVPEMSR
jgi:hypothetical protein